MCMSASTHIQHSVWLSLWARVVLWHWDCCTVSVLIVIVPPRWKRAPRSLRGINLAAYCVPELDRRHYSRPHLYRSNLWAVCHTEHEAPSAPARRGCGGEGSHMRKNFTARSHTPAAAALMLPGDKNSRQRMLRYIWINFLYPHIASSLDFYYSVAELRVCRLLILLDLWVCYTVFTIQQFINLLILPCLWGFLHRASHWNALWSLTVPL